MAVPFSIQVVIHATFYSHNVTYTLFTKKRPYISSPWIWLGSLWPSALTNNACQKRCYVTSRPGSSKRIKHLPSSPWDAWPWEPAACCDDAQTNPCRVTTWRNLWREKVMFPGDNQQQLPWESECAFKRFQSQAFVLATETPVRPCGAKTSLPWPTETMEEVVILSHCILSNLMNFKANCSPDRCDCGF